MVNLREDFDSRQKNMINSRLLHITFFGFTLFQRKLEDAVYLAELSLEYSSLKFNFTHKMEKLDCLYRMINLSVDNFVWLSPADFELIYKGI